MIGTGVLAFIPLRGGLFHQAARTRSDRARQNRRSKSARSCRRKTPRAWVERIRISGGARFDTECQPPDGPARSEIEPARRIASRSRLSGPRPARSFGHPRKTFIRAKLLVLKGPEIYWHNKVKPVFYSFKRAVINYQRFTEAGQGCGITFPGLPGGLL